MSDWYKWGKAILGQMGSEIKDSQAAMDASWNPQFQKAQDLVNNWDSAIAGGMRNTTNQMRGLLARTNQANGAAAARLYRDMGREYGTQKSAARAGAAQNMMALAQANQQYQQSKLRDLMNLRGQELSWRGLKGQQSQSSGLDWGGMLGGIAGTAMGAMTGNPIQAIQGAWNTYNAASGSGAPTYGYGGGGASQWSALNNGGW